MSENLKELDHHVKTCITIFLTLLCLTAITVAVSYLNLSVPASIMVALSIAMIKGAMVCAIFMHLESEVKIVFWTLALTITFFFFLMILPIATNVDEIKQTIFISY